MRFRAVPALLILLALPALAACGSNGEGDTATPSAATSNDEDLRPADEVIAEEDAAETIDGVLGEETDLGAGLAVTVSDMRPSGDEGGPWLEVDLRVENRGEDTNSPLVAIICSDSSEEGGWQADSTFDLFDELPADTFMKARSTCYYPATADSVSRFRLVPPPPSFESALMAAASPSRVRLQNRYPLTSP